jgi:hypothetical protein
MPSVWLAPSIGHRVADAGTGRNTERLVAGRLCYNPAEPNLLTHMNVPRLATAQTGPVLLLEKQILDGNPGCGPNRFCADGVVAQRALAPAAIELEHMEAALEQQSFPQVRTVNN